MGEVAARATDDDSVPGLYTEREKAATAPSGRRITADSFRLLTARLKKSSDNVQQDLQQRLAVVDVPAAPIPEEPLHLEPIALVEAPQPAIVEVEISPAPPAAFEIAGAEAVESPKSEVVEPPKLDVRPKPEAPAKARAEAHAFAMEAIAKLRKAAGVISPAAKPEPEIPAPAAEAAIEIAPLEMPPAADEAVAGIVAEVAEPVAEASGNRRPHPFFPDVFIDEPDREEAEAPEPLDLPEAFEAPAVFEPAAIETVDDIENAPAAALAEAPAEIEAAIVDTSHSQKQLYEETEIEVEQLPVEAELAVRAPQPGPAALADTDEDVALRENSELIEDEADAVKHLHGVEVIGIGDIAKAIFRNPTAAERAAFLEEVAEFARQQKDSEQAKEILAVEIPEAGQGAKPQVRKIKPVDDPFARVADSAPEPEAVVVPDEDAAELARSLLDMMLSNPNSGLPQERALAADALLKLVPRVPAKALISIVERLSIMENPPHLLVARLINDPRPEIAGPLLELCNHISDQLLGKVIATGQVSLQRLIARRRHLSSALTDQLVDFDDSSVVLTLVRNTGAVISHQSFRKLAEHAAGHHHVLAPLATRADLPAPIAFELFWHVPAELRRYLLSRFLTDSETLTKILKITNVMDGGEQAESVKFAEKEKLDAFVAELEAGRAESAARMLAEMAAISELSARRIIADRDGEPLAIALKAIGANRAQCEEYVERLKAGDRPLLKNDRQSMELQNVFDQMSFNKARVLLTYWDWAVLKSGPYSPAH